MIENEREKNDNLGSVWLRQLRQRSTDPYENCGVVQIPLNSKSHLQVLVRDGPLENLWGGRGGGGELQKKYSCHGLNKIHTRNLITKNIPEA